MSKTLDAHPTACSWPQVRTIAAIMRVENGEVIVGKALKNDHEASSEYSQSDNDGLFNKRLSKING